MALCCLCFPFPTTTFKCIFFVLFSPSLFKSSSFEKRIFFQYFQYFWWNLCGTNDRSHGRGQKRLPVFLSVVCFVCSFILISAGKCPCFLMPSLRSNAGSDNQVRLQAEILLCVWRQYSIWLHLPSQCPDSKVWNQFVLMLYFSGDTSCGLRHYFLFQWRDSL